MKISDLVVGDVCTITLVVKSANARETKAKKPYLQLELYDGTGTINGNYWSWTSGKVPAVNSILDVECQVTEWQGAKQLNIRYLVGNITMTLADFMPSADFSVSDAYKEAYAIASTISDSFLLNLTLAILEELKEKWIEVPGAITVHHAFVGGTLIHSVSVAKMAAAIATQTPLANIDLVIAGALLHDIGKLYTYKLNGISIEMTSEGLLYEHSFMGAEFIGNFADTHCAMDDASNERKVRLLRHIILSHHGKLEFGAAITPKCVEALIVSAADGLDANIEQIRAAASKRSDDDAWTERIYTLNNSPCLTPNYVASVMLEDMPF